MTDMLSAHDLDRFAEEYYLNGEIDPVAAGVVTQKNRNFGLGLVHNF